MDRIVRLPARFSVVTVIRQGHFWPHKENLLVQTEYPAVIADILVPNGHANIDEDVIRVPTLEEISQSLPRVP